MYTGRGIPSPVFSQVLILNVLKALCFDTYLEGQQYTWHTRRAILWFRDRAAILLCVCLLYFVLCGTDAYGTYANPSKEEAHSASVNVSAGIGIFIEYFQYDRRIIGVPHVDICLGCSLSRFTSTESAQIPWWRDESLGHVLGIVHRGKQVFLLMSLVSGEKYLASVGNPDSWRFSKIRPMVIPSDFVSDFQMGKLDLGIPNIGPLVFHKLFLTKINSGLSFFDRCGGLVSGSVGFNPLQASVVGVLDNGYQCEGGQNERSPLKRRQGEYLELCAFLFFIVGLWFVYTAFRVERITLISISKILFGVIILVLGWATEQAALNLIDFGHIDWSHLL